MTILNRFEPPFNEAHQPVEHEPDDANRDDAKDDVLVDEGVVFLPQETAHTRTAGQHFRRHDHQPRNPEAEPKNR